MKKPKLKPRWQCVEQGCEKATPYTDWRTCEKHNPYNKLFGKPEALPLPTIGTEEKDG
jgi:hypothetical protein